MTSQISRTRTKANHLPSGESAGAKAKIQPNKKGDDCRQNYTDEKKETFSQSV
jgi:hypothetical protein